MAILPARRRNIVELISDFNLLFMGEKIDDVSEEA